MIYVVDASAAVEYLLRTAVGERVGALLADAALAAPELLDAEVLAVLRHEVALGSLESRRAGEAVTDLREWHIERVPHRPCARTRGRRPRCPSELIRSRAAWRRAGRGSAKVQSSHHVVHRSGAEPAARSRVPQRSLQAPPQPQNLSRLAHG